MQHHNDKQAFGEIVRCKSQDIPSYMLNAQDALSRLGHLPESCMSHSARVLDASRLTACYAHWTLEMQCTAQLHHMSASST